MMRRFLPSFSQHSTAFGNKTLEDVLFLVMWIQDLIPEMTEIWEHSQIATVRDVRLGEATRFAVACVKGKLNCRLTEASIVKPISVVSVVDRLDFSTLIAWDRAERTR
jgi:hypothetical protein